MKKSHYISRRSFLKTSFIAGSGLLITFHMPHREGKAAARAYAESGNSGNVFAPNAWIRIGPDDLVTVMVKHSELGQGTTTASCMIVAEELEADWHNMRFEIAPVAKVYRNPEFGVQATGGSTGIKTSWEPLRRAGAATRELLISAAAHLWNVPVSECEAKHSRVTHTPSGRSFRYGQLLERAATLPLPENPRLKNPGEFSIIGKRFPRLDTMEKSRGKTVFGVDVKIPDLLTATVIHPPFIGGSLKSMDARRALEMPGVKDVLPIKSGVAVVAESFWQAAKGAEMLEAEWDRGPGSDLSSEVIMARFADKAGEEGRKVREDGDARGALGSAWKRIRAVYELPFQAHLCPEPMNCTAHVRRDGCDIWASTQAQESAREAASRISGLDLERIKIHTPFIGGGFGRRYFPDCVAEAVEISKKVKAPVKVIWSREEDVRNDRFRPAFYNIVEAGLDRSGLPIAWFHRAVGPSQMDAVLETAIPSIIPAWVPGPLKYGIADIVAGLAKSFISAEESMAGSATMPYGIKNILVEYVKDDPGVPVGPWRSVANSRNAFVVESFMDEIASASGRDPVDLRCELLKNEPGYLRVLELAVEKAGWGKRSASGAGSGVALHAFHGIPAAMVAELSVDDRGNIRVHRIVCSVDCGIVINPKIVEAQMAGGIIFGLTAALKSSIGIEEGRIREGNFDDFPILRMDEAPKVEVHIIRSDAPPGGIGEVPVPPVAPAVANAVFAATGKRFRKIPIDTRLLKVL